MPLLPSEIRRRLFVYGQRLARSLTGTGLKPRVLFLHLPKCGGTSLSAGLYATVPLTARIGTIDALSTRRAAALCAFGQADLLRCHEDLDDGHHTFALRGGIAAAHLFWTTRLVHGHVLLTPALTAALGREVRLVTLMREPKARALSNYRMAVRAGVIPDSVDAWLDGPAGQRMTRCYLRYLSGRNTIPDAEMPGALQDALAALPRFDVLGLLEDLPGFQAACRRKLGVRPIVPRLNLGSGPSIVLTADQTARLDSMLKADQTIYAAACRRRDAERSTAAEVSIPATLRQRTS